MVKRIKTTSFRIAEPKEFCPLKKAVLFLLLGDCIIVLYIRLDLWEYRNVPPLIIILSGFLMVLIYLNVKYLTTRITINPTGVTSMNIFGKKHINWSEIKNLKLAAANPSISLFLFFSRSSTIPFLLNYGSMCFLYGYKKKIWIPLGIYNRRLLIKTIINKAKLKLIRTKLTSPWSCLEWAKQEKNKRLSKPA